MGRTDDMVLQSFHRRDYKLSDDLDDYLYNIEWYIWYGLQMSLNRENEYEYIDRYGLPSLIP